MCIKRPRKPLWISLLTRFGTHGFFYKLSYRSYSLNSSKFATWWTWRKAVVLVGNVTLWPIRSQQRFQKEDGKKKSLLAFASFQLRLLTVPSFLHQSFLDRLISQPEKNFYFPLVHSNRKSQRLSGDLKILSVLNFKLSEMIELFNYAVVNIHLSVLNLYSTLCYVE